MFDWLNRLKQRLRPPAPPPHRVVFDSQQITSVSPDGKESSLRWIDLSLIAIETTDLGPFVDDLFWVLRGTNDDALVIPSESFGVTDLVERLQQLEDFDNLAMIEAMGSTEHQLFICWSAQGDNGNVSAAAGAGS